MDGVKKSISGNISNRPNSIAKVSTIFEKFENPAYPPKGPAIPNPGPTLLKQDAVAVNVVSKSSPLIHISRKKAKKQKK